MYGTTYTLSTTEYDDTLTVDDVFSTSGLFITSSGTTSATRYSGHATTTAEAKERFARPTFAKYIITVGYVDDEGDDTDVVSMNFTGYKCKYFNNKTSQFRSYFSGFAVVEINKNKNIYYVIPANLYCYAIMGASPSESSIVFKLGEIIRP